MTDSDPDTADPTAGRRRGLSVVAALQLIFLLQTAVLMGHMPFLLRCEPRGPQRKMRRKSFEEISGTLSNRFFRRIYRMHRQSFDKLYARLQPQLDAIFPPGKRGPHSPYYISPKCRLSMALRYFAGGCPYDIMQVHGVSYQSVFDSVWGVVDAINATTFFNYSFPTHTQQRAIAAGFKSMSGAGFFNVVGAIDGLVICTRLPSLLECIIMNIGQANFRCHRKDKYGLNLQAICDHNLKFIWADMRWPAATSDYMAWVTSSLYRALENNTLTKTIIDGFVIVGDCAYVKKLFMATPLRGMRAGHEDAYNFYLSQLRITIERAFGVFVHRWAILRAPLVCPIAKVPPLVEALIRLHNFCIDEGEKKNPDVRRKNRNKIQRNAENSPINPVGEDACVVELDELGRPTSLLGHGHHFTDAPRNRRVVTERVPMDDMIQLVQRSGLVRPGRSRLNGRN